MFWLFNFIHFPYGIWAIEFSQKPGRHEVWPEGRFGTIFTKVKVLFVQLQRFATGVDFLLIQGWPLGLVEKIIAAGRFSEAQLRKLAGNSFELGAIASALIAVLVHMPPRAYADGPEHNEAAELDAIADMFGLGVS